MRTNSFVLGLSKPEFLLNETLSEIFRNTVSKFPDKIALVFQEIKLTYSELDKWSDHIANTLLNNGINPGCKVGIWWSRGAELHAAILGIVKAGAAYVPLDREMPAERVEAVLSEVGATAYFSDQPLNLEAVFLQVPSIDANYDNSITNFTPNPNPNPDADAYVLYTSGSTGKPKGIPITHRNICQLIRAEQSVFNIRTDDRVYQGFSVSFDMWCEETWLSYFAGATIWVADSITAKAIDELSDVLREQKITILHAVPSLLAVMDDTIPTLRLINAGGEACTSQVLNKWATNNREFYNSYGPTETTVTASIAHLKQGDTITIGSPLPNYNFGIVDEKLHPLPCGEKGELIISGPGLSHGYINLPELTAEKFVRKPSMLDEMPGDFIYRTGDAAIVNVDGTIDFQGRFDDQIKLRGYRIELGEIETRLAGLPGIVAAAVAVKKDSLHQEQLVGYVQLAAGRCFDEPLLRSHLGKVLPTYMVPGTIVSISDMPRMPSGKINRKALPVPASLLQIETTGTDTTIDNNATIEENVLAVLHKTFPGKTIDIGMDFFTDLGGHSLLAAAFTSRLRREAGLANVSLKDVYQHRPIQQLVNVWKTSSKSTTAAKHEFNNIPWWRYLICWIAQSIALLFVYGIFAVQIFIPFLGYYYVKEETESLAYGIMTALGLFCLLPPVFALLIVSTKWLVIGKFKEGDYPLWGMYYFRWWLVQTVQRLLPAQFMNGTPLYPLYLRMLGVKVAIDAQLSSLSIGAEDLISIGSEASMSSQVVLDNATVEDGLLKLRKIVIGDHAYIGSSSIVAGGAEIQAWGELQDLSYLQTSKTIAPGEVWRGSPAQLFQKKSIESLPQPLFVSKATRARYSFIFIVTLIIFPFFILLPLLPVMVILHELDNAWPDYDFSYLVFVPLLAAFYIFLFAAETILATRILQKGIKPGKYPLYSPFYVRKWLADQLMSLSLIVMHPIYATVYVASFFRALGAKVGTNTEISTASSVTHPLLNIGNEAFVADAVTLGETDVRGQQLILDNTSIADNSFVGNSALIPQGYHLPGNMLIGVLSTPPDKNQLENSKEKDWFGSPAIALPSRQQSIPFPKELTTTPSAKRKATRSIVEFIRIIIPETAIISFSILFIAYAHDLVQDQPLWKILLEFPFYYLFYMGIPSFLVTVILKWVFIGKFTVDQKPMWTWKVWRSEAITTTYESLAIPFLLEYLQGTPWLPVMLRLLGVKIGKRVYLNTTDITEFDMVSIGDDVALNDDCGPQTHLFEDRVMKVGTVKIGARTSIGSRSIILYDSEIGNDVNLESLSLVMKGEILSPGTSWGGSPIKPL